VKRRVSENQMKPMTGFRLNHQNQRSTMKTTPWITLGALIGSSLIVSAQETPKPPRGPQGPPPPELVKQFDKDSDGKLSEDERKSMREAMQAKMEERRKEILAKYDADGDGTLSEDEKAKAMAERKAEMLKKFDTDGDGTLSKEERAKMPKRPGGPGGPGGKRGPGPGSRPGGPGTPPADAPVE
jgi:hypothetical protein